MPADLSAIVHSSNEIELVWTPSTDDGLVMGYDIIRDGVLIEAQWDANSFSDIMLEPAATYQYSVVAVDDDGNRGNPATVEVSTLEGQPLPPIISSSNHVELLRHVFDIYTGNAYFTDVASLPNWSDLTYGGLELPGGQYTANLTVVCLNGGTADFEWYAYGSIGFEEYLDFVFDNCQDDTVVFDGQLRRRHAAYRSDNNTVSSDGLTVDRQSQQIRFSGEVNEFYDGFRTQRSAEIANYSVSDAQSVFELSDLNTSISYGFIEGMSGSFKVRSDGTGLALITVDGELKRNEFPTSGPATAYDTGMLELVANDASKLVLNADNGDSGTVTIEITDSSGNSETLTQPWALWADHLKYEFELLDTYRWPPSRE